MNKDPRYRKLGSRKDRKGFLLLVTLLIIALVGILTVGLARHSMNLALESLEIERELQTKWGTASCQRLVLKGNNTLQQRQWSEESEQIEVRQLASSNCQFQLGSQKFNVRVNDESAKLSVNRAYEEVGRQKTRAIIRRVAALDGLSIELRPLKTAQQRGATEQAFESLEQVFTCEDGDSIDALDLAAASSSITCWTNLLNYKTAEEEILFESAKFSVGGSAARKLANFRSTNPDVPYVEALKQIGASERQVQLLDRMMTERPAAVSVWVETITNRNKSYMLSVREDFSSNLSRIYSFRW